MHQLYGYELLRAVEQERLNRARGWSPSGLSGRRIVHGGPGWLRRKSGRALQAIGRRIEGCPAVQSGNVAAPHATPGCVA